MGLNWFRVLVNPESMFILNVNWDASVLVGQLLALHEDSAMGWMTKELFINFSQGKVFSFLQNIQTNPEVSPDSYSAHTQGKQLGLEANHLSLSGIRIMNVWNSVCCTSTSLYTLTVWCLVKHGDSFTLYEVLMSCVAHSTNCYVNNWRWINI